MSAAEWGADAFDLAALVGSSGLVTGVDFSESLIGEAVRRAAGRSLVNFEVGDVQGLRFPDASFDAVRTERLLMHVPNATKTLSEMSRVLRPGGRMAVHDFDWETQFCDSPYKDTTRKIALSFCDGMKNGWIGRCLPRLFRDVGMTDISVSFQTITVTYDFLQLLMGGHLSAPSRVVPFRARKLTCGGPTSPKRTPREPSFTASRRLLSLTLRPEQEPKVVISQRKSRSD